MALQRHQLVWLTPGGWQGLLSNDAPAEPWDESAQECLQHWAGHDLPLVVTRQPPLQRRAHDRLMLGLAAPLHWERRRLALQVPASAVQRVGAFPSAAALGPLLPPSAQRPWAALTEGLARLDIQARVYGSHGWQQLSGLPCLRENSDIDLLLPVQLPAQADAAVALLQQPGFEAPRLDGEIVHSDGSAVAWREWAAWRAGQVRQLMVKRRHGATLVSDFAGVQAA